MKKILSVLLSAIIMLSICVTGFTAYAVDECTCGHTPIVYVTGFAMTDIGANIDTEDEYSVFPPEMDKLKSTITSIIFPLFKLILTGNYDKFADSVATAFDDLMGDLFCDDDGNIINPNTDIVYRTAPSSYHANGYYNTFRYDWREDVFDIAAELNAYIEQVKALTHHSKVALKSESMGGAVTMTYLKAYGHDSIETIVMQSSAFNGITLMGDLFTGNLDVKAKNAVGYINNFLEGNDTKTVIYRTLIKTLGLVALTPVAGILDKFFDNAKAALYEKSLRHSFGNIPGIWTFVPRDKYEEAKAFMLDEEKNAVLIEKIDRYHYEVMNHTRELLDDAMADGMRLAIISHYDKYPTPCVPNADYQSDFLIDTKFTSYGATCAPLGKTFDKNYTQQVSDGHNHISADKKIDASTCEYPEYTWFIRDMMHTWYTAGYRDFVTWVIYSDKQVTVWDNPQYPQFLVNNHETRELDILN